MDEVFLLRDASGHILGVFGSVKLAESKITFGTWSDPRPGTPRNFVREIVHPSGYAEYTITKWVVLR